MGVLVMEALVFGVYSGWILGNSDIKGLIWFDGLQTSRPSDFSGVCVAALA